MQSRRMSEEILQLAWAFATLGLKQHDSLLLAIAREAVIQIADFTEQNLSNTCWAYAKIGLRHDPLIKALADDLRYFVYPFLILGAQSAASVACRGWGA